MEHKQAFRSPRVFNCQGARRWPSKDQHKQSPKAVSASSPLSGHVSPLDVEYLEDIAGAVYAFISGSVTRLSKHEHVEFSLRVLKCQIFTISPTRFFTPIIHFAPLGSMDMYNLGGAIEALSSYMLRLPELEAAAGSDMYTKPKSCKVDSQNQEFEYSAMDGLHTITVEGGYHERVADFIF